MVCARFLDPSFDLRRPAGNETRSGRLPGLTPAADIVAVGWANVEETMDRAASNYREGRATGFGGADETTRGALRVTTVLRAEGDAWKIVHRQADPITTPQVAESVIQR
jgi:hypothetical protein